MSKVEKRATVNQKPAIQEPKTPVKAEAPKPVEAPKADTPKAEEAAPKPASKPKRSEDFEATVTKQLRELLRSVNGVYDELDCHRGRMDDIENVLATVCPDYVKTRVDQVCGSVESDDIHPVTAPTKKQPATPVAQTTPAQPAAPATKKQPVNQDSAKKNGPSYGFKYWDHQHKCWGLSTNLWAAKQMGNGIYEPIWAWYVNDCIDHIMSPEEIKQYCP